MAEMEGDAKGLTIFGVAALLCLGWIAFNVRACDVDETQRLRTENEELKVRLDECRQTREAIR